MESSIFLSDILKRVGLDIERVKLVRHSLNHNSFKRCYQEGFLKEYTQCQKDNFANDSDYILIFISGFGTSAKFVGCYKNNGSQPISKSLLPKGYPCVEMFSEDISYYNFVETNIMQDMIDRLIIDWGKAAIRWHQKATNEKKVLAIQADRKYSFDGYEM